MQRPGFVKASNLSLTAIQNFSSYSENVQEVKQDWNRSGRVAATCDVFSGKGNGLIHGSHCQWPSLCLPEHPLLPLPQGCVPLQGGRDSISEPGVELLHLEQVSGANLSSNRAVRVLLLLEAVLFHPAPLAVDCAAALWAQHSTRWECCLCKSIKDLRAPFLSEQELLIIPVSERCLLWFLLTHLKFLVFFNNFLTDF